MKQNHLRDKHCLEYRTMYDRIKILAEQTSLGVLLELFVALRKARGDVELRDQLVQTIGLIVEHGFKNRQFRLETLSDDLLGNSVQNRKITANILGLASEMPLVWGPGSGLENYVSLNSAQLLDLSRKLLLQKSLRESLGSTTDTIKDYVGLYRVILTLIGLNRVNKMIRGTRGTQADEIKWEDFLISSPHLPSIYEDYCTMKQTLCALGLPRIPFISLNATLWLISEELIHATLLQLFVNLLGLAQRNGAVCSTVANYYQAINAPLS